MNLTLERERLQRRFTDLYSPGPAARAAIAPGRVNLIGEHTDYNQGLVLPMAIDRHTAVLFRPNPSGQIRVFSDSLNARDEFRAGAAERTRDERQRWSNYVRGVAWALGQKGIALRGGDLLIASDLPAGAGLSSSAALEIAAGLALLELAGEELDPQMLALCGQRAEHEYAGVRCGIMDQTVVACARAGHALLLDCKSLELQHIPVELSASGYAFAIFDTGVRHELASSEYNKRRASCERAAQIYGRASLREVTLDDLLRELGTLNAEDERRTRHILSENLRVAAFAESLKRGDILSLGALLNAGHQSLARDFEVSCAELDALAAALVGAGPNICAGARMTGGGFGGAVLALVKTTEYEALRTRVAPYFKGESLLLHPSAGARVVEFEA